MFTVKHENENLLGDESPLWEYFRYRFRCDFMRTEAYKKEECNNCVPMVEFVIYELHGCILLDGCG